MIQALARSCNSYFYQLGAKLQIETIARYAKLFGNIFDADQLVGELIPVIDPCLLIAQWYAFKTVGFHGFLNPRAELCVLENDLDQRFTVVDRPHVRLRVVPPVRREGPGFQSAFVDAVRPEQQRR